MDGDISVLILVQLQESCAVPLLFWLCTSFVDPLIVYPLGACRLIALDKNPSVRPIGVDEVIWCIIALLIIRSDIQCAAGPIQLVLGKCLVLRQPLIRGGQCFLMIMLKKCCLWMYSLDRMQNIQHICPPFFTLLLNTYCHLAPCMLMRMLFTSMKEPLRD